VTLEDSAGVVYGSALCDRASERLRNGLQDSSLPGPRRTCQDDEPKILARCLFDCFLKFYQRHLGRRRNAGVRMDGRHHLDLPNRRRVANRLYRKASRLSERSNIRRLIVATGPTLCRSLIFARRRMGIHRLHSQAIHGCKIVAKTRSQSADIWRRIARIMAPPSFAGRVNCKPVGESHLFLDEWSVRCPQTSDSGPGNPLKSVSEDQALAACPRTGFLGKRFSAGSGCPVGHRVEWSASVLPIQH